MDKQTAEFNSSPSQSGDKQSTWKAAPEKAAQWTASFSGICSG